MRTRFAPSPTGYLHIGNAFSAIACQQWADAHEAELLLRIEDIDFSRCRHAFVQAIVEDLQWLGIRFAGGIRKQSEHPPQYQHALEQLQSLGVLYPCICTRKHIQAEIERMGIAPHHDDGDTMYPGTCRHRSIASITDHTPVAWRLDMAKAQALLPAHAHWCDRAGNTHALELDHLSDPVIGRKDIAYSYHLACVVDDAAQGITHIIRGVDLLPYVSLHRCLQILLQLPAPTYQHHPLLTDNDGNRLCKRNQAPSLRDLHALGMAPQNLYRFLEQQQNHVQPCWPFTTDDESSILRALASQLQHADEHTKGLRN